MPLLWVLLYGAFGLWHLIYFIGFIGHSNAKCSGYPKVVPPIWLQWWRN